MEQTKEKQEGGQGNPDREREEEREHEEPKRPPREVPPHRSSGN
jgi:hypothetical protein